MQFCKRVKVYIQYIVPLCDDKKKGEELKKLQIIFNAIHYIYLY